MHSIRVDDAYSYSTLIFAKPVDIDRYDDKLTFTNYNTEFNPKAIIGICSILLCQ